MHAHLSILLCSPAHARSDRGFAVPRPGHPNAPELPTELAQAVEKVFHRFETIPHKVYQDEFFIVKNSTSHSLVLVVFPDVPHPQFHVSRVSLSAGMCGSGAAVKRAQVMSPGNQPTQNILLAPQGSACQEHKVCQQTKTGVYVSIRQVDFLLHAGELLLVGSSNVYIKRGSVLELHTE